MLTALSSTSASCPVVTREMVYERTRCLAAAAGRRPQDISQGDYERAKRELTGLSDRFRQDEMLDSTLWQGPLARSA